MTIVPVILAGGIGERLWPVSKADYPKQFALHDESGHSLFQATVRHLESMIRMAEASARMHLRELAFQRTLQPRAVGVHARNAHWLPLGIARVGQQRLGLPVQAIALAHPVPVQARTGRADQRHGIVDAGDARPGQRPGRGGPRQRRLQRRN